MEVMSSLHHALAFSLACPERNNEWPNRRSSKPAGWGGTARHLAPNH
jgi:hypothetical protein